MKIRREFVIVAAAIFAAVSCCAAQEKTTAPDPWKPLQIFVGEWQTSSSGEPGNGTGERSYRFTLGNKFLEGRNTAVYPPQEKNPKGEKHEDVGLFSYDRNRKKLVLRQFHVEGFINQYVQQESADPKKIVFETEAIENIPAGWRARETYTIANENEILERFELAEPGKNFALYSETRMKRKSNK